MAHDLADALLEHLLDVRRGVGGGLGSLRHRTLDRAARVLVKVPPGTGTVIDLRLVPVQDPLGIEIGVHPVRNPVIAAVLKQQGISRARVGPDCDLVVRGV